MTPKRTILQLHPADTVGIAREPLAAGAGLPGGLTVRDAIPRGHKVALRDIPEGEDVLKFGQPIGRASRPIGAGQHVHVHNLRVGSGFDHGEPGARIGTAPPPLERTFDGYRRGTGKVGTRNYIGVLTTVNCSATVARQIVAHFTPERLERFPHVDGVVPITHSTGCGQSAQGEGIDNLRRALGGFARHPNFGGVLIIGLGCEVNQTDLLLVDQALTPSDRLRTLTIQEAGGTRAAIAAGIEAVEALLAIANEDRREAVPASHLVLALQCGGSDAWSGVTANPSLGEAADLLVRAGGSVILAETPEIYGAERLLIERAESREVADALLARLAWWEDYVRRNGQELNNNPSPGNIRGGLSTILEKSLGAVAKSGSSPLRGVLRYGEPVPGPGLHFMDSPGYDPCSVTGEIASGANIVCFTTGRGSVFGAKPTPSIKLASNAELAAVMDDDIDVDCSDVASGTRTPAQIGAEIFEMILDVASGRQSRSEALGFGDFEFVPWQIGAYV
jgi:altronate hydrolase